VESTVAELVSKAKEGIPVFMVMREKKKLFGGSKLKRVGLLKVLKATVLVIPSMLQYLSGGCSLDVMVGIDCTEANGDNSSEKSLHYSASHWLNDYQAGIQKLGSILENLHEVATRQCGVLGPKLMERIKTVTLWKKSYVRRKRYCIHMTIISSRINFGAGRSWASEACHRGWHVPIDSRVSKTTVL
jgi:hypothetical protein